VKALLQRVSEACVDISGEEVGRIGRGLVVFVGIARGDTEKEAQYLVQKITGLRIFSDDEGRFNLSISDIKGELLLVSQFTLLADSKKGRRPNFIEAASPDEAEKLFDYFVVQARNTGLKVATGRFQQHMQVKLNNDGPVTLMLDSKDKLA